MGKYSSCVFNITYGGVAFQRNGAEPGDWPAAKLNTWGRRQWYIESILYSKTMKWFPQEQILIRSPVSQEEPFHYVHGAREEPVEQLVISMAGQLPGAPLRLP